MFSLIVCTDAHMGLGMKDGSIPFRNPVDLANFKKITEGGAVIMGRKTWESLKKPLSNRLNVILSSRGYELIQGLNMNRPNFIEPLTLANKLEYFKQCHSPILIFRNLRDCLIELSKKEYSALKKFVIGGAQIYEMFISQGLIHMCYWTRIDKDYECEVQCPALSRLMLEPAENENDLEVRASIEANGPGWTYHVWRCVNPQETQFLSLLREISESGAPRVDRTSIGTKAVFGKFLEFDLTNDTLPLGTTKPVPLRPVFEELMWFLRGQTDTRILAEKSVHIWDANTTREFLDSRGLDYSEGTIGPTYGHSFRYYGAEYKDAQSDYSGQGFDQLREALHLIVHEPHSRRIIINLWNPAVLDRCALPPCLFMYQFFVEGPWLSCLMTQRSSDIALAGLWNIATGSLLCYLVARMTGLRPKKLCWSIGDVHIYNNQIEAVQTQLSRFPRPFPKLYFAENAPSLENGGFITDFQFSDLKLAAYRPNGSIKTKMNA